MANETNEKRKSTCSVCGKRLSFKTSYDDIKWLPSKVVDEGIYCVECYTKKIGDKKNKKKKS